MSKKIVIVEDDQAISQMYHIKFTNEGYTVAVAANGREGLEIIKKIRPDVVLLDLMMPEMNGDEMLEKLRATSWGKDTKVMILTNVSSDEVSDKIHGMNISGFIVKAQFTPAQVVEKIESLFS